MKQQAAIQFVIKQGIRGRCHCGTETNLIADHWYDSAHKDALTQSGMDNERAALVALQRSIKHQRTPGTKPYRTSHVCPQHATEAIDLFMGYPVGISELALLALSPDATLVVLDRNLSSDAVYPSISTYHSDNLLQFLKEYEDGTPHMRFKLN